MPPITDPTKKKKLSELEETFKQIQKSAGTPFGRVAKEGVIGAGGEMLIKPTETPILPGLGGEIKDRALGAGGEEPKTPEELLTKQLETTLTGYGTAPSLIEEKERLEKEKGVLGMRETVGSFEEEISKTQTLLDQLEDDITQRTREYLVSEPQRRRLLVAEQEPLLKGLGIQERGLAGVTGRLERTEKDILTELGLIEKEKTEPLDLFEREINIRSKIKDLTDTEIPGVVSSTFDDEGNLTIVTQDPDTGAFSTQTLKGVGEKAQKYQSISSSTDDQGNLTIIGVTRDGKSEVIGTFKGVGKAEKVVTTDQARIDEATTYFDSVKNAQGKVSPDDYIAAQRGWIGKGGNITDFKSAFPTDMIQEEQFLTKDWFIKTYGEDALIKKAKMPIKEGGGEKGAWTKSGKTEMNEYLDDIMKSVEAWRQAGKSDKEILAEMMK